MFSFDEGRVLVILSRVATHGTKRNYRTDSVAGAALEHNRDNIMETQIASHLHAEIGPK